MTTQVPLRRLSITMRAKPFGRALRRRLLGSAEPIGKINPTHHLRVFNAVRKPWFFLLQNHFKPGDSVQRRVRSVNSETFIKMMDMFVAMKVAGTVLAGIGTGAQLFF